MDNKLKRSTPEEQGVLSAGICSFIEQVANEKIDLHSFMFLRHAQVIAEGWWSPYQSENKRYVYSLSKSFTSTAVGFAVAEGLLGLNDKIINFFPDDLPDEVDENLAAMCVKDLLTMTTGHAFDSGNAIMDPAKENWVRTILSVPICYTPGTQFLYDTGASYLLAVIVQKVTGKTMVDYLNEKLFKPLGITDFSWDYCKQGYNTGGWGLSIRTEDIAKFGLLYQQMGLWEGKSLLPREWIEEATSSMVCNDNGDRDNKPNDWNQGYGYQFWRCQNDAYRADGFMGQLCIIMPSQEAVIVITSEVGDVQNVMNLVWKHLLPAIKDAPINIDPAKKEILKRKLTSLELRMPVGIVNRQTESEISGKHYKGEESTDEVQSIIIQFNNDTCIFKLSDHRGDYHIECGRDKWINNDILLPGMAPNISRLLWANNEMNGPQKISAKYVWIDQNTLMIRLQYLETAHYENITCSFSGKKLYMKMLPSFYIADHPILAEKKIGYMGIFIQNEDKE